MAERLPDFALPDDHCPACGHEFDAATNMTDTAAPKPGDLSVCISCATVLEFGFNLKHALFPTERLAKLPPDTLAAVARAQFAIRSVLRSGGPRA